MTIGKPTIYLYGPLRIEDGTGRQVSLVSAKAQCLLALLLTSQHGQRSRKWLSSMLWGEKADPAANLRQSLLPLKEVLGEIGLELTASRQEISIDLNSIVLADGQGEFLEGIDINEEPFEDWLREERQRRTNARGRIVHAAPISSKESDPWCVAIETSDTSKGGVNQWFESAFADTLARSLREIFSAPVYVDSCPDAARSGYKVEVRGTVLGGTNYALRLALEDVSSRNQLWSGSRHVQANGAPPIDHPDLLRMLNDLIGVLGDDLVGSKNAVGDHPRDSDRLCRLAIRSLFTMKPGELARADSFLEQAFERQERGLYLAWRAQLKAIQSIEKHPINQESASEEGKFLCARALELEPSNSMVLATVANALRRFEGDEVRSYHLSRRSVELNPANPMAWWALCAVSSYLGKDRESENAGIVAHRLAILSPNRFWWDNQRFVPAMLAGRFDHAKELAESAHAGNPNFRPPLRYLIALYAHEGRPEDALAAAEKLKALEADFSIDRLLQDDEYPASHIHRAPGLRKESIAQLI